MSFVMRKAIADEGHYWEVGWLGVGDSRIGAAGMNVFHSVYEMLSKTAAAALVNYLNGGDGFLIPDIIANTEDDRIRGLDHPHDDI